MNAARGTPLRCLLLLTFAAAGGAVPAARAQRDAAGVGGVEASSPSVGAAAVTLVARYGRAAARLRGDVDFLDGLAARYAGRGLRVVAVVADAASARGAALHGAEVREQGELRLAEARVGVPPSPRDYVAVIDADGDVLFRGAPGCGVEDMLERALSGDWDPDDEGRAASWRRQLVDSFDELAGEATIAVLEPLAAACPRDGLLNGILYLTYATKANDPDAARRLRGRAARAMSGSPRALAVFADLALRGDPRRAEVWRDLRSALERAGELAPTDPFVQRALLRARIAGGDDRAAGRLAMQRRAVMTATAHGCLDFASLLAGAETPMIYRDIAEQAVSRAAALGAEPRLLSAARYIVRLRCGEDVSGAGEVLQRYRAEQGEFYRLNSDAWRFLTQVGSMGRYDWFAAGLVDELLHGAEVLDYFELDTAALAMFLVGRFQEAVDLQRAALREGGQEEAAYRDRLVRYEASVAPAPR